MFLWQFYFRKWIWGINKVNLTFMRNISEEYLSCCDKFTALNICAQCCLPQSKMSFLPVTCRRSTRTLHGCCCSCYGSCGSRFLKCAPICWTAARPHPHLLLHSTHHGTQTKEYGHHLGFLVGWRHQADYTLPEFVVSDFHCLCLGHDEEPRKI